ncbi:prepilin-type N-terminal cleavage/methylation domain-containing protein [Cerasicoccus frondis]|uniref:prepilin-type N-terminal cleavage/methylation domain-containing protein n=1 Tax=Cerasicoccus frondis TaxID=490090 RepID=UPI002852D879|nr:prepilin-type N-terminal cleavage/methylation domain-containing protein [Cerasicoccus frondis]
MKTIPRFKYHAMLAKAFTLTELLVVIAVIAILAAILIPVIGHVKSKAHAVQCSSNLGQIGKAAMMWSADNQGRIVPCFSPGDGPQLQMRHWTGILAPYLGWQSDNGPSKSFSSYEDMPVYICPERPGTFGYSHNWHYLSYIESVNKSNRMVGSFQVINPVETVFMADSWDPTKSETYWKSTLRSPSESTTSSVVHFRHPGNTANVLWLDGHVSSVEEDSDFMESDYYFQVSKGKKP